MEQLDSMSEVCECLIYGCRTSWVGGRTCRLFFVRIVLKQGSLRLSELAGLDKK